MEWGGEIRTAGTHPEGRPWRVFISRLGNPDPSTAIDTLDLNDMSLATSGDYHQSWKVTDGTGEHRYTHVIDPRTHQAVEVGPQTIASVSVLAPKCMVADALATAAMLSPTNEEAIQWTRRMQARLQGTAFWLVNHENKHVASVD